MKSMGLIVICTTFALGSLVLSGCGDKIERNIKKLEGSSEEREQAMMELVLAKQDAIGPLIEALRDKGKPSRARVDLATALFRMYMRESDVRIFPALLESLEDKDPKLRAAIVVMLNDIGERECIAPLLGRLYDPDEEVVYHALFALEVLRDKLEEGEQDSLVQRAAILVKAGSDTENGRKVRAQAEEILEVYAEEIIQEAEKLALKADLEGAEATFLRAKKQVPNSLNVNLKLGKFYLDNGQKEKGLKLLTKYGLAAYVPRFRTPPQIDGDLSDACWKSAAVIDKLYQKLENYYRAQEAVGKSEVFLGYTAQNFYVAMKVYKKREDIVAEHKGRDSDVWRDDCLEVFMDTNQDYESLTQICVNSLGEYFDMRIEENGRWNNEYNGVFTTRAKVEDDFWSVELEIPYKELETSPPKKGTIWGFNLISTRMGDDSEQAQWAPTYARAHTPSRFGFLVFD